MAPASVHWRLLSFWREKRTDVVQRGWHNLVVMAYILYRELARGGGTSVRAAVMTASDAEHRLVPNLAGTKENL